MSINWREFSETLYYTKVSKRKGILQVSEELLKQLINIPKDAKIVNVAFEEVKKVIVLFIESENLNEVEEGSCLPNVTLSQILGYDE